MTLHQTSMKEQAEDTGFATRLQQYRQEIDAIDRKLLGLLVERSAIVASVGRLKQEYGVSGSYIRPGREAVMLRKLLDEVGAHSFPRASVAAIWRIIIGSSTALESPLNTVTFETDAEGIHAAAQYFGPEVPHLATNEDGFFALLEANPHTIAIVPYDLEASWWQRMPDPMRVFACLPFVGGHPTHLALGQVVPEPTGEDVSLFYDYGCKTVFTVNGFHTEAHPLIAADHHALFIGSYAAPYHL